MISSESGLSRNSILATRSSCGNHHTLIMDMNNKVWSFESNYNGRLGLGDSISRNIPTNINSSATFSPAKSVSSGGKFHGNYSRNIKIK